MKRVCWENTPHEPLKLPPVLFKRAKPQSAPEGDPNHTRNHSVEQPPPSFFTHERHECIFDSESLLIGQVRGEHDSCLQHIQRTCQKCSNASGYRTHQHVLINAKLLSRLVHYIRRRRVRSNAARLAFPPHRARTTVNGGEGSYLDHIKRDIAQKHRPKARIERQESPLSGNLHDRFQRICVASNLNKLLRHLKGIADARSNELSC